MEEEVTIAEEPNDDLVLATFLVEPLVDKDTVV